MYNIIQQLKKNVKFLINNSETKVLKLTRQENKAGNRMNIDGTAFERANEFIYRGIF